MRVRYRTENLGEVLKFTRRRLSVFRCWVLPGLDSVPCLIRLLAPCGLYLYVYSSIILVCVISSLPSVRLSPEGSRLLSAVAIAEGRLPLPYLYNISYTVIPACIAVMSVTYIIPAFGCRPL
jgi:hypothetical protein